MPALFWARARAHCLGTAAALALSCGHCGARPCLGAAVWLLPRRPPRSSALLQLLLFSPPVAAVLGGTAKRPAPHCLRQQRPAFQQVSFGVGLLTRCWKGAINKQLKDLDHYLLAGLALLTPPARHQSLLVLLRSWLLGTGVR